MELEQLTDSIYTKYNRKELISEFLEIFGGDLHSEHPIRAAVAQRDYEAIGGLLCAAFDEYLYDCAEYDARRELEDWA